MSVWCKLYLALVLFSLGGCMLVRFAHVNPGAIAPGAAVLTLTLGVITVTAPFVPRGLTPALAGIFLLGLVVERVGVGTGYPFGPYFYTDLWWPTVKLPNGNDFPVQVPFAWGLVTLGSYAMVARLARSKSRLLLAIATGLLAALVDLVMEPVMTNTLGYWHWLKPGPLPGGAPIMNFVGWWGTAAIGAAMLKPKALEGNDLREPVLVLAGHVVMVVGIGLIGR